MKARLLEEIGKKLSDFECEKVGDSQFYVFDKNPNINTNRAVAIVANADIKAILAEGYSRPPIKPVLGIGFGDKELVLFDYLSRRKIRRKWNKISDSFSRKLVTALPNQGGINSDALDKLFNRADIIEEFYQLYRLTRDLLQRKFKGLTSNAGKLDAADQLLLTMMTLWFLQERGFFDQNENYFIDLFNKYKAGKIKAKSFFSLLQKLFLLLADGKSGFIHEKDFGRIPVLGPALFLWTDMDNKTIDLGDECFYKKGVTEIVLKTNPKKLDNNLPLLNLLESRDWTEGSIDEYVLGAIYEKLITEQERKETGAFYTPEEITSYIAKHTIEPFFLEKTKEKTGLTGADPAAVIQKSGEKELPALFTILREIKIVDPAVGSAHFLESAINTLVGLYEEIWKRATAIKLTKGLEILTANEKGSLEEFSLLSLRPESEKDHETFKLYVKFFIILSRNVYGVDINPQALKIARARLFLTLAKHFDMEEKRFIRFPNVHFNLKEGNSLIGYLEIPGSGKAGVKAKKPVQFDLFAITKTEGKNLRGQFDRELKVVAKDLAGLGRALGLEKDLAKEVAELEYLLDDNHLDDKTFARLLAIKADLSRVFIASLSMETAREIGDLIAAIERVFRVKLDEKFRADNGLETLGMGAFHWPFEFPDIEGFDVVIGNPPWKKVKANDADFFDGVITDYRELSKDAQEKAVNSELRKNAATKKAYDDYLNACDEVLRASGELYSLQGSSDVNYYKLFLERVLSLTSAYSCLLVPGSITVDEGSIEYRQHLLKSGLLYRVIGFHNREDIFKGIDNNQKFVMIFTAIGKKDQGIGTLGWLSNFHELQSIDPIATSAKFLLDFESNATLFLEKNSENFRLLEKIRSNRTLAPIHELDFHFWREFDATNDMKYFNDRSGTSLIFSGKAIGHYDAYSRYWIEKHGRAAIWQDAEFPKDAVAYRTEYYLKGKIPERIEKHHGLTETGMRIVVQDITGTVNNVRTTYAALLPLKHLTNNTLNNLTIGKTGPELVFAYCCIISFVVDWQARRKVATHMNKFIIETLILPKYKEVDSKLRDQIVRLACALIPVNNDYVGLMPVQVPLITDAAQRQKTMNKIDALVAKAFDLTEAEFQGILETFTLVKQDIRDAVLAEFKKIDAPAVSSPPNTAAAKTINAQEESKNFFCTDASIVPVIATKKPGPKWQLFGISEVHGMGSASHDKNLFGEEYDEIVPLNSMKGLSYIVFRQGKKWGLIQIKDNQKPECEIKKVSPATFASADELLQEHNILRGDFQ